MRILGIDPGLTHTGWGVINFDGFRMSSIGHGIISSKASMPIYDRLAGIYKGISSVINEFNPDDCAIEEVFVNMNPASSLKLGLARGVSLCVPAMFSLKVFEYSANKVKKTVVGNGHATKEQISKMVQILLCCDTVKLDASDALAIAICHAHHKRFSSISLSK